MELHVTGIRCISRSAALPFEVTDAARSSEAVRKAAEAGELLVTVNQVGGWGCWVAGRLAGGWGGLVDWLSGWAAYLPCCFFGTLLWKLRQFKHISPTCAPPTCRTLAWTTGLWTCAPPPTRPSSASSRRSARWAGAWGVAVGLAV